MRIKIALTCLFVLPLFTGCAAVPDVLFSVFGDHYTGGGITRVEKKDHYDRQVEASQSYKSEE